MRTSIYRVSFTPKERRSVLAFMRKGTHKAREVTRARVLLAVDDGKSDQAITQELRLGRTTPLDIRKRYCEGGLERALYDAPRSGQPVIHTDTDKTTLVALACSNPPTGRNRWTLELLEERLPAQTGKRMNRESIRLTLKKMIPSHG